MDRNIEAIESCSKSSHSGAGNNNCVEVVIRETEVLVRDSKNPEVPPLRFTAPEWEAFIRGVLDGEFDL